MTRRQERFLSDSPSVEVTLDQTDYEENSLAELNFTAMFEKLDLVLNNLSTISENVSKIFDFMVTNLNRQETQISTQTPNITNGQSATQELCENIRELIQETNQPTLEREARRIKQNMENIWYKKLNDRKRAFWLKLRNEHLSKTYEDWRNTTPIILPQHLQMYPINGEPEDQRRRRERQVLDNFKTEKDLLELRAQSQEEKYRRIDEEMSSIISEKVTGRKREILIGIWYQEAKDEETISQKRWETKNQIWLKKYEEDFKNKYADKNPFLKDLQEIQTDNRNYSPPRNIQRGNRNFTPAERRTTNTIYTQNTDRRPRLDNRPTYAEVTQRSNPRSQQQRNQRNTYNTRENTTYIGRRFNQQNERGEEYPRVTNNRRPQYDYTNRGRRMYRDNQYRESNYSYNDQYNENSDGNFRQNNSPYQNRFLDRGSPIERDK